MAQGGEVTIQAKDAEALKKYAAGNAKTLLEKGVKIEEVKGMKSDFAIAPSKGGYKLTFGDAEFVASSSVLTSPASSSPKRKK